MYPKISAGWEEVCRKHGLIYRTVSYVSGNFKHSITLESMARDLGVSKYVLSRIFLKHSIKTSTSTWMMPGWDMHVSDLKIPMIQSRSSALTVDLKVCALLTVRLRKSSKLPPVNTGKQFVRNWNMIVMSRNWNMIWLPSAWSYDILMGRQVRAQLIWPDNICREDIRISGVSLDTEKKVSWSSRK